MLIRLFKDLVMYGALLFMVFLLFHQGLQDRPNIIAIPSGNITMSGSSLHTAYDVADTIVTTEPHSPIMLELVEACLEG